MSCNYKVRTRSMARNGKDSAQTDIDIKDGILPSVGIAPAEARTLSPSPNPALALQGSTQYVSSGSIGQDELVRSKTNDPYQLLLQSRKDYKRSKSALDKCNSHLMFMQDCIKDDIIPRGLAINKNCYAFKKEKSDINEKFKAILREAENELVQALQHHYETLEEALQTEVETIKENIQRTYSNNNASAQEWAEHVHYMEKTDDNLKKTEEKRQLLKLKKANTIKQGPRQPANELNVKPKRNWYRNQPNWQMRPYPHLNVRPSPPQWNQAQTQYIPTQFQPPWLNHHQYPTQPQPQLQQLPQYSMDSNQLRPYPFSQNQQWSQRNFNQPDQPLNIYNPQPYARRQRRNQNFRK